MDGAQLSGYDCEAPLAWHSSHFYLLILMRSLSLLFALGFATFASAQSITLQVNPTGTGLTYGAAGANFVDVNVLNPLGITLQALEIPLQSPGGTEGIIQVWTKPGTHIGSEQVVSNWTLISEGPITSAGFGVDNTVCQTAVLPVTDTFLAAGVHGFAIVYVDVDHQFIAVTTYPSGPYADANVSIDNGTTQSAPWTVAPLTNFTFNGTLYSGTVPDFSLIYAAGNVPHACAECVTFGEGSNLHSASAFDLFSGPAATAAADASAALQGNSISYIPSGNGYIVTAGSATFVPPSGGETNLPLADDQETQISIVIPFQYQTESGVQLTNDISIHSNGYVSMGIMQSLLEFGPLSPQNNMQADLTAFYSHYDYNNTEIGSGQISYEEDLVAQKLFVTWDGVEGYPDTLANPSTIQFQLDLISGQVDVVWEIIDPTGGATIIGGNNTLIGWSPAGPSPRTDEFDYTTLASAPLNLSFPEVQPLTIGSTTAPLIGGQIDFVTSNDPSPSVGITLISSAQLPAPLDLSLLGAPAGAVAYLDPATSFISTISNLPGLGGLTVSLPVPSIPALAGQRIFGQSFWLDLAAAGFPFQNIVSSNAAECLLGNF
jgi:hypothetical protein